MDIVLTVVAIVVFGFVLNVILKQSYNFIFFIGKKPVIWICIMPIIAILFWFIFSAFSFSVNIPVWSTTIALFFNWPPKLNNDQKELAIVMYQEMGIKNGPMLHRLGLGIFLVTSIIGWLLFYGQM